MQPIEEDQKALWNGVAGHAWVDAQETMDAILRPFEALLVAAVAAGPAGRVLDVGCGTGGTTLAYARLPRECTGIDISAPMIELARVRAQREHSNATFVCDDVETHAFAPASFATIVSRFGVMFFPDPVRAFTNLRAAAQPGAQLRFVAWRSAAENPFMTAAERAAAPLLPEQPARNPDGPGQFAFADAAKVRGILDASGWSEIDIQPIELECTFAESELMQYVSRLGPIGRILTMVDEPTRAAIVPKVRAAFDPYVHGDEVRFSAACWNVAARNP
ncbi:MAG TPA: class I SAM-dependent methyltransferase [Nannocystaceae bacterium]|nr:class I SAM-dependent methyltransferase [Nannocystaceae bacterium]